MFKLSEKTRKQLVVSGCSMVSDYVRYKNNELNKLYYSYIGEKITWINCEPFKTIDFYLANEFNLDPCNIAIPGSGNEKIFYDSFNYITKNFNKIKILIVCWSDFNRIDIRTTHHNKHTSLMYRNYDLSIKTEWPFQKIQIWNELYDVGGIFPEKSIEIFLMGVYLIDLICRKYNIVCVQCCTLKPIYFEYNSFILLNHHLFDLINCNNFYGWPCLEILGGDIIFDKNETALILNDKDRHPNELGHKEMATKLINFIKERQILA